MNENSPYHPSILRNFPSGSVTIPDMSWFSTKQVLIDCPTKHVQITRPSAQGNQLLILYPVSSHGSLDYFCGQLSDRFFSILRTLLVPSPLTLPLAPKHSLLLAVCISALLTWQWKTEHAISIMTWN